MLMTAPFFVETTWPQPTPQKGQTVVVGVAPRVLIGGIAGPHPACERAPAATAPVVNPPKNWRRVGFTWSPSFIDCFSWGRPVAPPLVDGYRSRPNTGVRNSTARTVMSRIPARFSQRPAFIIWGSRTRPVPNTIAFGGVPTGIM